MLLGLFRGPVALVALVLVSTEHEGPYAQSLTRHIIPQIPQHV